METKRKNSKKRQAILDALCATKEHPTAEMLYNQLKPDYPELSLGTVYRNLSILAEDGLVTTVVRVAGQERYDADTSPHAHFVCRECKRVMDMNMPEVVGELSQRLDEDYGFAVESCSLNFTGLCMECRKVQAS
jgi:Fur family peroxide stress response transcriptional regulator